MCRDDDMAVGDLRQSHVHMQLAMIAVQGFSISILLGVAERGSLLMSTNGSEAAVSFWATTFSMRLEKM